MRKIKFRGKVIYSENNPYNDMDGKWVDGFYIEDLFNGKVESFIFNCPCYFLVNKETVGQFTGLTDKNGKEIYEGDILKYDTGKHYVVVYSTEGLNSNTNDLYIGAFMLKDDHGFHELICSVTRPYKYAEIIGNIHDNPELLTK